MLNSGMMSSSRDDWETPQEFFDKLNAEFHFTLDPCATPQNAKCKRFFTKEDDGLKISWWHERVFMNPPYGKEISKWIAKAFKSSREDGSLVVCLIAARTDTKAWHDCCMKAHEIRFIKGRLCFGNNGRAPFPSCVVIFEPTEPPLYPMVSSMTP